MAFTEEQKQAIHDDLYNSLKGYASVQDINYAASRIIEDPSPENLDKVREGLINVASPTTSGIVTPDNQIKNIVKNELIYLQSDTEEQTVNFIKDNKIPAIGETFVYGKFNTDDNKPGDDPLDWILVKVDKENSRALCVSRLALVMSRFRQDRVYSYQGSTVQSWCADFYDGAFTEEEKQHILLTDISDSKDPNIDLAHVFILSVDEATEILANQTLNDMINNAIRENISKVMGPVSYSNMQWLRTKPVVAAGSWPVIKDNGVLLSSGQSFGPGLPASIRPAMYISLDYFREGE